jgi:hypothetical protein
MRPYLKNKIQTKSAGDMDQVVEYLRSMHEVLGSIPENKNKKIHSWAPSRSANPAPLK